MNNEELKKKIVDIALTELQVQFGCGDTVEVGDREVCAESIADALIAAGIGDVSSEKAMRELAEAFHREKCAEYDLLNYQMQKSEYRIAETEHRAARAERALLLACAKMVKDEKDDVNIELLVGVIYRKYLKQAEKELAEEKKDE